ncbi:MAG TPA: hypothetical protein DDW49_09275, partial [Deltaproteobacteria bacterium]|nr:hypothetical protein [Deltaproteobacteria bacterium]
MVDIPQIPRSPQDSKLRLDYSRVDQYLYPDPPKLSFWQHLGRGLLKGLSFLGPIAGSVLPFFGPAGVVSGLASYGVGKGASDMLAYSNYKFQQKVAASQQPVQYTLGG